MRDKNLPQQINRKSVGAWATSDGTYEKNYDPETYIEKQTE